MQNFKKYKIGYFPPPNVRGDWMKKDHIEKAPIWCSVDLRDGNQALVVPMSLEQKLDFFKYLVTLGFKEIEVGFPAASNTEYEFVRRLIEDNLIPDDVTIQVLTQARDHIIEKTFKSLEGISNAIVHLYNSTSLAQREQVFKASKEEIIEIATNGAKLLKEKAKSFDGNIRFEYSPESFTGTEMEFALDVCNAVIDVWKPREDRKVTINLPSTVSMSMPHIYANQIEYMCDNLHDRENLIVSLHPHNDRGTAVAEAELGILAGGDRIEGTLFGNGERTGNVDLVTLAMNLYAHGVNPNLHFNDIPSVVDAFENFTDMQVNPRQPYGGKLVFAAFSGSHQDAIAKGMKHHQETGSSQWTVPYLPIDPKDIGKEYEADVIRINSQSGKGGVAYIIEQNYGYVIPKDMRAEVGYLIKDISDKNHSEIPAAKVFEIFDKEYIDNFKNIDIKDATFKKIKSDENKAVFSVDINVIINNKEYSFTSEGNGRLDAVSNALLKAPFEYDYRFVTYSEHALESHSDSMAAAYILIEDDHGHKFWGIGTHSDIILASVNALVSALNRANNKMNFVK
ncbi:MAG: 2-isopropylmalate synthase [Peptostreptococcaceae bacterium]|nr:2-isopropylmalate synthase [Peptostreptococcaceae bacterium]